MLFLYGVVEIIFLLPYYLNVWDKTLIADLKITPDKRKPCRFLLIKFLFAVVNTLLFSVLLLCQPGQYNSSFSEPAKMSSQYVHDSWNIADGLQSNSIQAITQTTDGYLWLGTYNGLFRFDGVKFILYNRENTDVFTTNTIYTLCPGKNGELWIGTIDNGLVNYRQGKFKQFTTEHGLLDNTILSIYRSKMGELWIGSPGGITRYRENRFIIANPDKEIKQVVSICSDNKGKIWFASKGRGLYVFQDNKFDFLSFADHLPGGEVTKICSDGSGKIWIGTGSNKILKFSDNKFAQINNIKVIPLTNINAFFLDNTAAIWIGNDYGLLKIRDGKTESFSKESGLTDSRVRSIFEDREENIWIGTYAGGLNRFKKGPVSTLTEIDGLKNKVVYSVYHDTSGNIWIGTKYGGVHKLKNKKLRELKFRTGQQPGDIKCFLEDSQGNIWIGSTKGLFKYSKLGMIRDYTTKNGLSGNSIRCLHQSVGEPDLIWIGTLDGGLNRFRQGKFETVPSLPQNRAQSIRWIYEDHNKPGILWIGSSEGLLRLEKGSVTKLTTEQGLSTNQLHSFCISENRDLWIGTKGGGLNLFRNNKFYNFTTSHGLLDDYIWSVLDDSYGNLWLSSDRGIFKIKKSDLYNLIKGEISKVQPKIYGKSEGMKSNECNGSGNPSARRSADGRLFYPTQAGLAFLDPVWSSTQSDPIPVYVETVMVENKKLDLNQQNKVAAGKRNFEFHFTAISFYNPGKIQFRYMLEGYDRGWSEPISRRVAYYTNLSPGEYRFRVIAAGNDGVWNTKGATVTFSLGPYFYETWWFYLVLSILMASLIYTGFRLSVVSIKKRNLRLLKEIRERKHAEAEMIRLRNLLRNMIDSMPSVLIGVDKAGYITHWNFEAQKKTGVKTADACGRLLQDVYPKLKLRMKKVHLAIKNKKSQRDEKIPIKENGETYFNNITVYPLVGKGVEGAVIRIDDVTELEKKEEQLRQAQKMETVGTLAGGLAHDFNNVLGGILGSFSLLKYKLLQSDQIPKEKMDELFEMIEVSGKRATTMIQHLLTLSRNKELTFTVVDLNTTLRNVMNICKNSLHKSVKLDPVYFDNPVLVNADATQIEQVLLNLCVNSDHAMTIMRGAGEKWGGTMSVSIKKITTDRHLKKMYPFLKNNNYWIISVRDDGVGMDSKTKSKIFNPFFTRKEKGQGTGLGLSIAYNIIKQHSGFINIYSTEKVGSTFNIFLPVLKEGSQPSTRTKKPETIQRGEGLILVVEDEKVLQRITKDILEECGYSVITADNGREAIEVFNQRHHDIQLVILDLTMPEMSGEEAFAEMVKTDTKVKVLLTSGYSKDKRITILMQQGVKTFIEKPYNMEKLANVVHQIIKGVL